MKILHVIPYLDPKFGGPPEVVINTCKNQRLQKIDSEITTILTKKEKPRKIDGIKIRNFKSNLDFNRYSLSFKKWIKKNIKNYVKR